MSKRHFTIEHLEGGKPVLTTIEEPVRAWQPPDERGNGGLRIEFSPVRARLEVASSDERPGLPKIRPYTVDQIESHLDAGEAPSGVATLRGLHHVVTDGFGTTAFYRGEMSDGQPGDKFLAFHSHATNARGIVITRDHKVVLQRESRQGRVDKTPILMGIAGGCKSMPDLSKVFRSEVLQENGCRASHEAVIYEVGYGPASNPKWGWWVEDGVFGWPVHYVIATGYEAKTDHRKLEENISGIELVPLVEFKRRAMACEYEDPTLIILAQAIVLDADERFSGIAAPHRKIWESDATSMPRS